MSDRKIEKLEYGDVSYRNADVDWLLAQGVPQAAIDAAETAVRLSLIKAECQRRIYAVLSAEAQTNIATAAAVIGAIDVADRTAAQIAMLAKASDAVNWVAAMRSQVQTIKSDEDLDYATDEAWPDCPATVTALAEDY